MREHIHSFYGGKIRVRSCAVIQKQSKVLFVLYQGIGKDGMFWSVPGGEPHAGENLVAAAIRETCEETGLHVTLDGFLGIQEYLEKPLHAVEIYFKMKATLENQVSLGTDPETDFQTLKEVKWMSKEDLEQYPKSQYPPFYAQFFDEKS